MKKNFALNWQRKSTYKCQSCGKQTRETGLGEQDLGLCAYCFEEASLENSLSDGHITQDEFDAQILQWRKQYRRDLETGKPLVAAPKIPKPKAKTMTMTPLQQEVYDALPAGREYTAARINEEIKGHWASTFRILTSLVKKGVIVKNGQHYRRVEGK